MNHTQTEPAITEITLKILAPPNTHPSEAPKEIEYLHLGQNCTYTLIAKIFPELESTQEILWETTNSEIVTIKPMKITKPWQNMALVSTTKQLGKAAIKATLTKNNITTILPVEIRKIKMSI